MDAREVNITLDFCLRVGELLLSHGAGAADVTATMRSLSRHLGLRNAEIDVTFVTVGMSHQSEPDEVPVTANRQVKQRVIDYEHLTEVDHLVRKVLRDEVDLRAARSELGRITSTGHHRNRWAVTLATGMLAGALAVMLGGGPRVGALALIAAVAIDRFQLVLHKQRMPGFYQQLLAAGLVTLLAVVAAAMPFHVDVAKAITANIILLLTGIGFVGALQDALTGFYLTGAARIIEAMLSTAGIIAGVSGGLSLASLFAVEIPPVTLETPTLSSVALGLSAGGVAAAAFAYASYAPIRILLPIFAVAGVATLPVALTQSGAGSVWPVGAAAFLIGLVSYAIAGRMKVPPLVIVIPGVVPLLPGMRIYYGLAQLSDTGNPAAATEGILSLFAAASVAIALAAGVILGEYVAQPLRREASRLESRLVGPRLVGPVQPETMRRERTEKRKERRRREAEERRARKRAALAAEAKQRAAAEERRRQRLSRRSPW